MPQNAESLDEQLETAIVALLKADSNLDHISVFIKGAPAAVFSVYPYIEVEVLTWRELPERGNHTGGRVEMEYRGTITVYGQWTHQASVSVTDRIGTVESHQIISRTIGDIKTLFANKRSLNDLSNVTKQWAVTLFELGQASKEVRPIALNQFDVSNTIEFICRTVEVRGTS